MPPLLVLVLSFSTALLLTPIAARVATALGWIDRPNARKVHGRAVPYMGGAAVFGGLLAGGIALWFQSSEALRAALTTPQMSATYMGAAFMLVVGVIDDAKDLRPRKKLIAQIVAASLVLATGSTISGLQLTPNLRIEFGVFSPIVTLFWIVGVTNAVNIIDGLDGLCSTLSAVAAGLLAWTAFQLGLPHVGGPLLLLCAAILGFLPFNLHPAKIFLGDAGSLLLGFLLSSWCAVMQSQAGSNVLGWTMPLLALSIPVFDTISAMVRRILDGRSITSADRNHIHHRLLDLGYHQRTVVIILGSCALVTVMPLIVWRWADIDTTTPLAQLCAALAPMFTGCVFIVALFRHVGALRFRYALSSMMRLLRFIRGSRPSISDTGSLAGGGEVANAPER